MFIERIGRRAQGGLSLIELIMFIIIVGIALAGTLTVLNMTSQHSADPMVRKQMLAIAEGLLEEVEMQPFTVCDPLDANASTATTTAGCALIQGFGQPAGATNRGFFNNVGSYCIETGTGQAVCTPLVLGTAGSATSTIPDLTSLNFSQPGYWATIQLIPEALGTIPSVAAAAGMNVLRIKVTVNFYAFSENLVLEGYRTRWAPHQ